MNLAMKAAYEILGYPTYHWVSMMENPPDMDFWISLLEKKYPLSPPPPSSASSASTSSLTNGPSGGPSGEPSGDSPTLASFDALLGHVSAVTDSPSNAFAADLILAYPSAKVILVEREVDSWYRSFDKNVISSFSAPLTRLLVRLEPTFIGKQGRIGEVLMRGQWGADSFANWRGNAKERYLEHNEQIKKMVQKERLLVYQLGSGWEPLCQFLGREVPKVAFPRVNETEELKERVFLALMLGVRKAGLKYARLLTWLVPVLAGVWWVWRVR
jgi:hypothetical protein